MSAVHFAMCSLSEIIMRTFIKRSRNEDWVISLLLRFARSRITLAEFGQWAKAEVLNFWWVRREIVFCLGIWKWDLIPQWWDMLTKYGVWLHTRIYLNSRLQLMIVCYKCGTVSVTLSFGARTSGWVFTVFRLTFSLGETFILWPSLIITISYSFLSYLQQKLHFIFVIHISGLQLIYFLSNIFCTFFYCRLILRAVNIIFCKNC